MGLFDALQGMMGRPDPSQQLYAALGQAPGQPGNPAGAQPGPAPPGAPNAGGGPPGAASGPQVYQSPPDLAQAYQALAGGGNAPSPAQGAAPPPDLAQMYMAMQQREQAKQGFWGGLAGVAKALHPGRVNSDMMQAIRGPQDDTGSLFNNIVQLQQWQQQNQAMQAYRAGVPGILKGMGLSDDQVKAYTPLAQADPSFATKLAETNLGVGGSPAWMAQKRAQAALDAQGKPLGWVRDDPVSYDAYTKASTETSVKNATDITTAKNDASTSFNSVDPQWKTIQDNLAWLNDPAHKDAVINAIQKPELVTTGQVGENLPSVLGGQDQDTLDAKGRLDTLQARSTENRSLQEHQERSSDRTGRLNSSVTRPAIFSNQPTALRQSQTGWWTCRTKRQLAAPTPRWRLGVQFRPNGLRRLIRRCLIRRASFSTAGVYCRRYPTRRQAVEASSTRRPTPKQRLDHLKANPSLAGRFRRRAMGQAHPRRSWGGGDGSQSLRPVRRASS